VVKWPSGSRAASAAGRIANQAGRPTPGRVDELDKVIGQATATISTDIVKMARDLSTHVGQATDEFDKKQAALEAKYSGTPTTSVDAKGRVLTTLHGGLLNEPGITDQRAAAAAAAAHEGGGPAQRRAREGHRRRPQARQGREGQDRDGERSSPSRGPLGDRRRGHRKEPARIVGRRLRPVHAEDTWLSYFNRLFPDKAQLSEATKLGFRNVREVANAVIDKATDDYVAVLKKAGQAITRANLYAVHLLGAPTLRSSSRPRQGRPTSRSSARRCSGNPFLKGTAEQARAAIASRIGDSSGAVTSGAAAIDQALKAQAEKELQQQAAFDSDRDRLNGQLLDALGQVAVNYQEEAASR
jgi:hypothetical protein